MKIKTSRTIFAAGLMAAVLSSPIQAGQDQTMFELGAVRDYGVRIRPSSYGIIPPGWS